MCEILIPIIHIYKVINKKATKMVFFFKPTAIKKTKKFELYMHNKIYVYSVKEVQVIANCCNL